MTRESILAVLRPGQVTTERPLDTLRGNGAASKGFVVYLRLQQGRMGGSLHLYNALNGDAARAYRLGQVEVATELAKRAGKLERTLAAKRIVKAIARQADSAPADPLVDESLDHLRRYIHMRRSCWKGLDKPALSREWLAQSWSWLADDAPDRDGLLDAVESLKLAADKARAQILDAEDASATTFFGWVARMDAFGAELESESGEVMVVPREDLDRQGLAVLGQAVSLLREALPGGGSYVFPMPAVAVDRPLLGEASSPWGPEFADEGIHFFRKLEKRDADWTDRKFARAPKAVPAAPFRIK